MSSSVEALAAPSVEIEVLMSTLTWQTVLLVSSMFPLEIGGHVRGAVSWEGPGGEGPTNLFLSVINVYR